MSNERLYKYLTTKSKERGLPIEGMPVLFGFSRSSLYRYMKGITRMSADVQAKFIRVLHLNETEQQEFKHLVGLSEFDNTMIAARMALDSFVFDSQDSKKEAETIQFAYHENDVFLRTSDEICEQLCSLSADTDAVCNVRIVGCMERGMIGWISQCLEKLFSTSGNVTVEHLLTFSEKDHLHNANTLIDIIPLLKYRGYSVLHSEEPAFGDVKHLFKNTILIDISRSGSPAKYFIISILDDDLSACLASPDKTVFAFFGRNYEALKASYHAALLDASSLNLFGSHLAELQDNVNCYVLKPNCCYDKIPMSVYQSLVERIPQQELDHLQRGIIGSNGDMEDGLKTVLSALEKRIDSSYRNDHIDIYSTDGLSQFAKTGRITDHLVFLPSFNEQERRTVLEYIRNRSSDPDDRYKLYITKERILENGYIIVVLEGLGIMIEYDQEEYRQGVCSNLFIRNKMLADVFSDYIKNHVPDNRALSAGEATAFLDSLIAAFG